MVVPIKLCKIRYLNYSRLALFPRNQGFFPKNCKFWRASTTIEFNIFCWDFAQIFCLVCLQKDVRNFFYLFRSWVIHKSVKNDCVETRSFLIFENNSRSKQNKKNPTHFFVDSGKYETCAKLQQKILNCQTKNIESNFQTKYLVSWKQ